jgi:hypothetical protein
VQAGAGAPLIAGLAAALDEKAAQRFLENPAVFEQAATAARDFGLHECTTARDKEET